MILGCTHYPLVRPVLQRALGRGVKIVTSGEAIADEVERALARPPASGAADRRGDYRFLCSGDPEAFRRLGTRFLQLPMARSARGRGASRDARAAGVSDDARRPRSPTSCGRSRSTPGFVRTPPARR